MAPPVVTAPGGAGRGNTQSGVGSAGRGSSPEPAGAGGSAPAPVAASGSSAPIAAAGSGGENVVPAAGSGAIPSVTGPIITEPSDPAAYLFDQTKLLTYNIQVAPADLAALDQNPGAEQYVQGMIELEGQVYGPVGVRYKGGYSGFQPPCANGVGTSKSGKCSIKVAFDEYDGEARFFGLRKLNLHSMNADPSLMHDRLGYALFREFGVAAPRAVHALVYINGISQGLFALVEQVDGRFSRARFVEGGEGNIYKEIWPLYDDARVYVNSLEANKAEAQVAGMVSFSDAVKVSGGAALPDFIDRDYTLRYMAVDRVIMNDDGVFHFWCSNVANGNSPNDFGNHNYYWYQEQAQAKFWLVPWDLDIAFAFNLDAHIIVPWHETATSCQGCMQSGDGYQRPSSCDPLMTHFIDWKSDYEQQVDTFLAGPFAPAAVNAKLETWTTQIASAVEASVGTPNAPDVATWQSSLTELRQQIDMLRANRGYAY